MISNYHLPISNYPFDTMISTDYYIILSAILFTIGALGVLIRRNPLVIFMQIGELQVVHVCACPLIPDS